MWRSGSRGIGLIGTLLMAETEQFGNFDGDGEVQKPSSEKIGSSSLGAGHGEGIRAGSSPTTTTTRRLLNRTSRNPPAKTGPWPRMTLSTMTTPSLSSPLFTQERENAASRRRAYHSHDEVLSSSQSSSVGHRTGDLLWNSLTHKSQTSEKIRAAAQKMSKSGFFWNDKESRFSLIVKQRFKKERVPGRL